MTATLDAAVWGAELAFGDGRERIYLVEPTGEIEHDPRLNRQEVPWKFYTIFSFNSTIQSCWRSNNTL